MAFFYSSISERDALCALGNEQDARTSTYEQDALLVKETETERRKSGFSVWTSIAGEQEVLYKKKSRPKGLLFIIQITKRMVIQKTLDFIFRSCYFNQFHDHHFFIALNFAKVSTFSECIICIVN